MSTQQPKISLSGAQKPFFFGVDVGGTNIKIGLVDDLGRTLAFDSVPTNEPAGPQQAVEQAARKCRELAASLDIAWSEIPRVGLGAPGTMCLKRGLLLEPPNLPHWSNFPIQQALAEAVEHPVSFINDANAAAFGEFWVGTGAQNDSLALLTLGTGVGGGFICDGRLIKGHNSFGSEAGHIIVDSRPDARLCVWGGGRGHLEAYASASAVAAIAKERLDAGAKSTLQSLLKHQDAEITAKQVYLAAKDGDAFALELIDETAIYLAIGITSTVHTVDPGLVVLGGAMNFGGPNCPVGKRFLHGIVNEFKQRTFPNVFAGTRLDFASLGGDAGYIGAAGIARQDFRREQ
ncbi:MAG: ROK family protein [Pirellulaceae bacterium]